WKLTGNKEKEFIKKVKEKAVWNVEGDINEVWGRMATCVKSIAKEIVGETKSSLPENKETWWWDEEIQRVVASKKKQFKLWQKSRKREDWVEYKSVCKKVKSAVSKAKLKRYDELYERLGTREGEKEIYRLAKIQFCPTLSGGNRSQIDYFMWKRDSLKRVKDCKVIPGESVITQHRLMIMEIWCSGKKGNALSEQRKLGKEWKI
nr:retrovirus-related Pol polyprotein LINE-1 [Tanacetum cinerariifolium]